MSVEQLYGLGTRRSPGTIPALVSSWAVRGARLRAVRYVAAVSHSVASDSFATPWTV